VTIYVFAVITVLNVCVLYSEDNQLIMEVQFW